jgi:hypothetical protein
MSKYIIRALSLETEGKAGWLEPDAYLLSYDPDAFGGRGDVLFTPDKAKALRFADHVAVFECLRQQPRKRPLRPDGKPNRPITAFTLEIQRLDDE